MADERRYSENEVSAIFELAAAPRALAGRGGAEEPGLTLAQLQQVGREAGLDPQRVAEAATLVELRRTARRGTFLGLPTSVGRIVTLPRQPTDREWEQLVASLRETFDARGHDRSDGVVRHWANGNLHAFVEPDPAGIRLRLRTRKSDAPGYAAFGVVMLLTALVILVEAALAGMAPGGVVLALTLLASGLGMLGVTAARLPRWAREREEQMEQVAVRAVGLLAAPERDPAA
jgi:hypothetical protein